MTPSTSNPNFDKEKPEGSRETVDESLRHQAPQQKSEERTANDDDRKPPADDVKPGAGAEPPVGT
jgi:hypothetical protein